MTREKKSDICTVKDCGRTAYTRGLCQTHHRQVRTKGKAMPIRPYRKRMPGTVKFAGLRLTRDCAEKLRRKVEREGISKGAAIEEILEAWFNEGKRSNSPNEREERGRHC